MDFNTVYAEFSEDNNKLLLECQEDSSSGAHPHCPHGPTLLFYKSVVGRTEGYFACAAHRDKRSCGFFLKVEDLTEKLLNKRYDMGIQKYKAIRKKFLEQNQNDRQFCNTCNKPLIAAEPSAHNGHEIMRNIKLNDMQDPTRFLQPLENDKVQAQYFFDNNTLKFFKKNFAALGISKVVCMGAPALHAYLKTQSNINSFLLDFDYRFFYFYNDDQYAWFNMCNNYFFDEEQKCAFENFLKIEETERLCIFTDPPFGCRTETITNTLHQLKKSYNKINKLPNHPIAIFWIYPYFSENHIKQQMPELRMCDYKINYKNHTIFTKNGTKARKLGSPVRIFTNMPLQSLCFEEPEGYKYCAPCGCYTAIENRHCSICQTCPSKNGATYQHCNQCGICVKSSYKHCAYCRRCILEKGHDCNDYQKYQHCWICLQKGHTEFHCLQWKKQCKRNISSLIKGVKKQQIVCLLCGSKAHNERNCPRRALYLEEFTFFGETNVKFKN